MPRPNQTLTPLLGNMLASAVPDPSDQYSLVLEDVSSGARVGLHESDVLPSASLYKLPVAWSVMRQVDTGALTLDAPLAIEDEDAVEVEPDGGVAPGETPTVREALAAMLSVSSNAAAHAFLRVLGRHDFNTTMAQLGLAQTRVPEEAPTDVDDAQDPPEAVTSAADMAQLLHLIAIGQGLSPAANEELLQMLAVGGSPDALRDALPESVGIYDKTGNLDDASNVGAVLRSQRGSVVLVVIDHGVDPGDARTVISQLARSVYASLLQNVDH